MKEKEPIRLLKTIRKYIMCRTQQDIDEIPAIAEEIFCNKEWQYEGITPFGNGVIFLITCVVEIEAKQ